MFEIEELEAESVTRFAATIPAVLPSRSRPQEFDLELASGRLHGRRFGRAGAPLVLCLPGLAANSTCFDFIGERLGGRRRQVVSLDLRGRGRSPATSAGTYGWPSHARDVLEVAARLGCHRFSLVGHSMGAFVAMQVAAVEGNRLERVALLDGAGVPDSAAWASIADGTRRPGRVFSSMEDYLEAVQGTVTPWNRYWERYFLYDVEPLEGGLRVGPDRSAVLEDVAYGGIHDPVDLWPSLTMPVLLLRARVPLGGGFVVSPATAEDFRRRVPQAKVAEVDADHYGILMHPQTVEALRLFLGG